MDQKRLLQKTWTWIWKPHLTQDRLLACFKDQLLNDQPQCMSSCLTKSTSEAETILILTQYLRNRRDLSKTISKTTSTI